MRGEPPVIRNHAIALALLLAVPAPALGFDANGVALGAREAQVKRSFPSALCKPLEWKTDAAERRCDDARASVAGVPARITFYLRNDGVRAFDLRFDRRDLERMRAHLKASWGEPRVEATEVVSRRDGPERRVFRMRWEKGADSALLAAPLDRKRASIEAARGEFFEEVYRVR